MTTHVDALKTETHRAQALNPPEKFRKKTLCFLKLTETELSPENVDRAVIYGDFGDVPLEHLAIVAEQAEHLVNAKAPRPPQARRDWLAALWAKERAKELLR